MGDENSVKEIVNKFASDPYLKMIEELRNSFDLTSFVVERIDTPLGWPANVAPDAVGESLKDLKEIIMTPMSDSYSKMLERIRNSYVDSYVICVDAPVASAPVAAVPEDWAAYEARRQQIAKNRHTVDYYLSPPTIRLTGNLSNPALMITEESTRSPFDCLYESWGMACWAKQQSD